MLKSRNYNYRNILTFFTTQRLSLKLCGLERTLFVPKREKKARKERTNFKLQSYFKQRRHNLTLVTSFKYSHSAVYEVSMNKT
jgi:hypothetical protein